MELQVNYNERKLISPLLCCGNYIHLHCHCCLFCSAWCM